MTPASSVQAIMDPDNDEPDIHRDDYHYRSIRDFQVKMADANGDATNGSEHTTYSQTLV